MSPNPRFGCAVLAVSALLAFPAAAQPFQAPAAPVWSALHPQPIPPVDRLGLNPQPIPPVYKRALNPQPIPPVDRRGLNPQPIPPADRFR